MKLQSDLREFVELLNSRKVDYLVVDGHAVAFHGYPRFTGDIDFFVRPTGENADRIMDVLVAFGFGSSFCCRAAQDAVRAAQNAPTPNRRAPSCSVHLPIRL